jgi:ABC-type Zn2+ transport system substrate-binding protein/surface adhesin
VKLGARAKMTGKWQMRVSVFVMPTNASQEFNRIEYKKDNDDDDDGDDEDEDDDEKQREEKRREKEEKKQRSKWDIILLSAKEQLVRMHKQIVHLNLENSKHIPDNATDKERNGMEMLEDSIRKAVTSMKDQYLAKLSSDKYNALL